MIEAYRDILEVGKKSISQLAWAMKFVNSLQTLVANDVSTDLARFIYEEAADDPAMAIFPIQQIISIRNEMARMFDEFLSHGTTSLDCSGSYIEAACDGMSSMTVTSTYWDKAACIKLAILLGMYGHLVAGCMGRGKGKLRTPCRNLMFTFDGDRCDDCEKPYVVKRR